MLSPEVVKKANQVLRELDSVFPYRDTGITNQMFKWCWSSDLWALIPELDDSGDQRYQFICRCGTDVQVHAASCEGLTHVRQLMVKSYMVEEYGPLSSFRNMWVLCSFCPPPSREEWIDSMGTDIDYPANGRYLPVFKNGLAVVIPPRTLPDEYESVSRLVVRMVTRNIEAYQEATRSSPEIKRMLPRMDAKGNMIEEPHKSSPFWAARDRIRSSRPRFDLTATVGAGGKTGRGHVGTAQIHKAQRSIVDQVARAVDKSNAQMKKELAEEIANG